MAALLLLAACGGDDDEAGSPAAAAPPSTPAQPNAAEDGSAASADEATGGFAVDGVVTGQRFDWRAQRVDRGTKPGIALTADGTPVIAYLLERTGAEGYVRVATQTAGGFAIETLQNGYLYGPLDVHVAADDTIAVAYHNHDWEDGAVAIGRDGAWAVSRIAHPGHDGWDNAVAFDAQGRLHTLGIDPSQFGGQDGIEYAILEGGTWNVEPLGSGPQPYEWGTDIAVDADGTVHAVYYDSADDDLIYATRDGDGWTAAPIYTEGDAGRFPALVLDVDGRPHVAFYQSPFAVNDEGPAPGAILYGTLRDGTWTFEAVGRVENHLLGFEGARRTVDIDLTGGEPVVAFIDERRLALATRTDGVWLEETLIEATQTPLQVVGLAIDAGGAPHLTFSELTARGPLDADVWYLAPLAKDAE